MGLRHRPRGSQVRFAQGARRVHGVFELRELPVVGGRRRRRRRAGLRHRPATDAVRLVVDNAKRGRGHRVATGPCPRPVLRGDRRQHASAMGPGPGPAHRPRCGRFVRQDQAQDPVRRDRPAGRVRVLRHQHRRRTQGQAEPAAYRRARHRPVGPSARASQLLRQASGHERGPETRRRAIVLQGRHIAVPDRRRRRWRWRRRRRRQRRRRRRRRQRLLQGRRDDRGYRQRGRGTGPAAARAPLRGRQVGRAHTSAVGGRQVGQRASHRDQHTDDGEKGERR